MTRPQEEGVQSRESPGLLPSNKRGARFLTVWVPVRAVIWLFSLVGARHEGLYLTAQALIYIGDATAAFLTRSAE